MDWVMLSLLLLMLGKHRLCQQEEVCTKSSIISCNDCIKSGPFCAWCKALNFTKPGQQETVRCDTRAKLIKEGCSRKELIYPDNLYDIKQEDALSSLDTEEPVQITPQKISLTLRPGLPHKFNVTFKRAEGYPVDLYYLMDLSFSMKDDLQNVQRLGDKLFAALNKITRHAKIGFGAFVDKTVLPYTNTNEEKLKKPCDADYQSCQAAFGYRHVLSMTSKQADFKTEVAKQNISGNLDSPEGSLDAMMQAAVCLEKIGWRNSSTRLIVLATDAGFHMAGDGKLAGILEPNDELCHMQDNLYSKSSEMDYPSVGQLAIQLEKNNIQPIFAVTENVKDVYLGLSKMFPKSEVGVLSDDSGNVVNLIEGAYNKLSSKVTLTHDNLPENIRVEYKPLCPNPVQEGLNKGVCNEVHVGQQISFEITVTVDKCMEEGSFTISPLGIKDKLTVTVSTNCECSCNDSLGINHHRCNNSGIITCGICKCNDGFVGQFCNCNDGNRDGQIRSSSCQMQTNSTECEGRGDCVCGRCQCHTTEQGSSYHGDFCECDDEHCEKYQNKLCAGHGKCRCGKCECDPGHDGSACQCPVSDEGCRTANNTVCFGRGKCKCSVCECDDGYQQPDCHFCLGCTDPCPSKLNCIECLGFKSGSLKENCIESCNQTIVANQLVKELQSPQKDVKICRLKDSEGCWIDFSLHQLVGRERYYAEIVEKKECPEPPNVTAIIAGSVASVALIGIVLLMLIKFLIYMRDLKEFKNFEKEKKKSKWADQKGIYQTPITNVVNPVFTGE